MAFILQGKNMFCAQQGVPARIFKKRVEKVELTNEMKVATSY